MSSTSGFSELDMSSCSASPASYTESPKCSPLQRVPQTNFTDRAIKRVYAFGTNGNMPYLRITEQPQSHFRFRYDTEKSGSTHGCLLAKSCAGRKGREKTFPTVELVNYDDKAIIKCSVKYQNDKENLQEPYRILEDNADPISFSVPQKKSYKVGFRGIGIHYKKISDLATLLYSKRSEQIPRNRLNVKELRSQCDTLAKAINQNIVRLQFSAFTPEGKEICDPVLSDPISNSKSASTNVLNICRMNSYCGLARGGEDLFLLVDKIDKKDIEVRFYEENEHGEQVWSAQSFFAQNEVHYQCVIICRTPPYREAHPLVDVPVYIQLVRPSDGSTSLPKRFIYKADETCKQIKRRKMSKPWPAFPDTNAGSVGTQLNVHTKIPVYRRPQSNQITNGSVIPQTINQSNEWNVISNAIDTVLDNSAGQVMVEHVQDATIVSQENTQKLQLQGDLELQTALDVFKSMQSQTELESQEFVLQNNFEVDTNIQGTVHLNLQDTTNLRVVDESRGLIELHVNGSQAVQDSQLLEDFGIIEDVSQETVGVEPSPMWGQVQLSCQPQSRGFTATTLPAEEPNTVGMPMEEDISQAWFAEYENLYKMLDPEPKDKILSYVSDSGRVKIEMKTTSTQTDNNENREADTFGRESNEPNTSAAEHAIREVDEENVVKVREEASFKDDNNKIQEHVDAAIDSITITCIKVETEADFEKQMSAKAEFSKIETMANIDESTVDTCKSTDAHANKSVTPKLGTNLEAKIQNKPSAISNVFLESDTESTEDKTNDKSMLNQETETYNVIPIVVRDRESSKNIADKCKAANTSSDSKTSGYSDEESKKNEGFNSEKSLNAERSCMTKSDSDYPVEFSPEDATKVKKLVQELAEIVRSKKRGATDIIRAKLQQLMDIRRTNGDTFLHMALFESQQSFIALVKMIHAVKMSHLLNIGNGSGETILHLTMVQGSPALVELLVERGCCVAARTRDGDTCVHYAVRYGGSRTLLALLDAAAPELDALNAERCAALHLCALHARAACARLLCERGASLDVRDAAGRTPLHLCALDGRVDVARALLEHAAPEHVEARDATRRSALALVCARRPPDLELARLLLAHRASPPPSMARHPTLAPLLREFLSEEEFDSLVEDYESDEDFEEYESADDESIEASESLASRLEDLELFDDAESSSDLE